MGFNFDGIETLRAVPLIAAGPGKGGLESSGEIRPLIKEGRRPGCEEERLLPVIALRGLTPGSEDDAGLDPGIDPDDVVESAGDEGRGVGGAEDFAILR